MNIYSKSKAANVLNRCSWCGSDPIYQAYHDYEWGKPIFDDQKLFALLCLESMQAGLSWITILKRKEALYRAFDGFNPLILAAYDESKINALKDDATIIRHAGKIYAMVGNAKAYLKISKQQSFSEYVWGIVKKHQGQAPLDRMPKCESEIPTQTKASIALSKQLKKDGFKFVGPTICYAFMQACGMVNDHVQSCNFR
ncbi:DNA-3-methyladenine glycosylase I [Moraxella nasovis]|uniref:DNA-3-methyladenine glycosylase I n=1 Tax=Moraxella nasovis TaxID=2904121 RepID=UPI001F611777|nr:DNA-3-methyladenine glycosylase I [Moraxella nasovis]UNU72916.1 DNA-3-methyladenine glycosylase I [Moraxella nasovis]